MHKFDYSFLADGLLPANLVNLTANIASLSVKSAVRKADFKNVFASLEGIAKVQSVKSSNAIEGIITSDERIAAIVHHNSAPLNHDEAEIAGYRDALNEIHLHYNEIPFSVSSILRLHSILFAYTGTNFAGKFKTEDNVILEIDAKGNRQIRFRPTPAAYTEAAMEQLVLAYMEARDNANINQLL